MNNLIVLGIMTIGVVIIALLEEKKDQKERKKWGA